MAWVKLEFTVAFTSLGQLEQAEIILTEAMGSPTSVYALATTHNVIHILRGEYDRAFEALLPALELDETLTEDYLNDIMSQLDLWYSSRTGFVLSSNSAQCFSTLHMAIREKPESNGMYLPEQIDRMVRASREFRKALQADILLLFNEDVLLAEDFLED